MTGGGKGANQALAVHKLSGDVSFIAKIGNDLFGQNTLKRLEEEGLNTRHILIDDSTPSGVALISVDAKGENAISVAAGANMNLLPEDIKNLEAEICKAEYILVQLETPMQTIEYIADLAQKHNIKLIINPAPAAKLSDEILRRCYLITPNETECSIMTGLSTENLDEVQQAAKVLLEKGVRNVIITLGSRGSLLATTEGFKHIPSIKVKAVDTTAAGDTYNGALCVALSEGKTIEEAMQFATKASAISVTRFGAQPSIPTRQEVDNLKLQ